ncbi:MAG: hypothetical protein K2J38_06060 [Muribaculaceae bacterium]|nr:hypothetical protein [Muribaculaceae bacterium]
MVIKKLLILFVAALLATCAQAREISIGELRFHIPDTLVTEKYEGLDLLAFSRDMSLMVKHLSLDGKDEAKVREKGEFHMYPKLTDAVLLHEEQEPWHDWTHDYIRRTYAMTSGEKTDTVISYQLSANGSRYFFLLMPHTPTGVEQSLEIASPDNIDNGKVIGNAGWWWGTFIGLFFLVVFIAVSEERSSYSVGYHASFGIISLAVYSVIALLVCHFDLTAFLHVFWWGLGIVVITPLPFMKKPIVYILEHID